MRPKISNADLLRAFDELNPSTDQQKTAIAEVLGLQRERTTILHERIFERNNSVSRQKSQMVKPSIKRDTPTHSPAPVTRAAGKDGGFTISGPVKQSSASPLWAKPSTEFESATSLLPPPSPEVLPLFLPRWTRAILSTALAVRTSTGQVDIREVVSEIARGRVLQTLPRLGVLAMAQRVQILVDVGTSMLPFASDQRSVVDAVQAVAGFDNVTVLKFTGSPLQGAGTDDMLEWPKYFTFLPSKTHVLLLSDLGIGRPPLSGAAASVEEWCRFGWELRRRRIACTAFVPYPANRWPPALTQKFRLVEWDRATTAGTVRFSQRPKSP